MFRVIVLVAMFALAACASAATAPADPPAGDVVNDQCKTDADCEVKNVGNCCGYYPACVNRDSPTFPERVKEECARKKMSSICGFPEISGCSCVQGRCNAADDDARDR